MFRLIAGSAAPFLLFAALVSADAGGFPGHTAFPVQEDGKQVFDAICTQCHSVQPPARQAPPMSHIARHYLMEIPERDEAAQRIADWVREPSEERSLLDSHAIRMWGVMPPVALGDEQALSVAEYVISLADSARRAMGRGAMGMGRGMMGRDSTGVMRGMGRGMMRRETTGAMRGMGMGRRLMGRDTAGTARGRGMRHGRMGTDTLAAPPGVPGG